MHLTTFNIHEGWPMQSQFYYNNKINMNKYETYTNDNFAKEDHSDLGNSPNELYQSSPKAISEAYYDRESNENEVSDRKSRHFITNNFKNESDFCAVDTSNSNCPMSSRNTSFITKYSHIPVSNTLNHSRNSSNNENIGEKKFISELHINIKEPNFEDYYNNENRHFQNDYGGLNNLADKNSQLSGFHLSSFETFITGQQNQQELAQSKNNMALSEVRSSSPESPNRKRECHHSEKFIYLGCDAQTTPIISEYHNEVNTHHSEILYEKCLQRPFISHSRNSDNNDDLKSFTTKSVQTLRQIDCLIKDTCDQSVETDNVKEANLKLHKDQNKPSLKKMISTHRRMISSNSMTDNESISSENLSEIKIKKYRSKHEIVEDLRRSNNHDKRLRKASTRGSGKNRYQNTDDTNQDTYAGSYSESFSQSNDFNESPVKENQELIKNTLEAPLKINSNKIENKNSNGPSHLNKKIIAGNKFKKNSLENRDLLNCNDVIQNHVSKEDTDRHSHEIQCLLDNLNTHLQNTVNSHNKPMKMNTSKAQINPYNNIGSFWDNPLNPETTRSLFMGKQNATKVIDPMRQKSINPEIQAIFETLDKTHNYDKLENGRINQKQIANVDLSMRNQKIHKLGMGDNYATKMNNEGFGSNDNLNDNRFPSSLKFQKSFDLSPYDELVKSHLNSSDRRIKSVAAKNGCRIVIDGPISLVDPTTTCQAIRNKIAFRCGVAGPSKDRLDKCLNYLKETFPNTCLRIHSRNNLGFKA